MTDAPKPALPLHEILIRGDKSGNLIGASQTRFTCIDPIEAIGLPAPIEISDVAGVLGDSFPALAAQITTANAAIERSASDLDDARALARAMQSALDEAQASLRARAMTASSFMALFTPAEQSAILATSDTPSRMFLMKIGGDAVFDLGQRAVIAGVIGFATADLIEIDRAFDVLAGQPAPLPSPAS